MRGSGRICDARPNREITRVIRVTLALYLTALALLPWSWLPPFPLPMQHAQWSDAVFAAAVLAWVVDRWQSCQWPRWGWLHIAVGGYVGAAALSLLLATPDWQFGAWKLLGLCELGLLTVITADLAARPNIVPRIGRVIAVTALLSSAAALLGMVLFYAGVPTRLIGTYGDLLPSSSYARAEAGTYHPNLLASFCIFAMAVVARPASALPGWLRRVAQAAIGLAALLTFSRGMLAVGLAALIARAHTRARQVLVACYATICVAVLVSLTIWNIKLDPAHPLAARFASEPASRWQTITSSWRTLIRHPFWGSGLQVPPGRYRGVPFDAHLTPLNIAATMGVPALVAFLAIPIILWRRRARPTDWALWGGLAGLALDALAQDIEDFRHVWALFGLAAADSGQSQRPNAPAPEAMANPS